MQKDTAFCKAVYKEQQVCFVFQSLYIFYKKQYHLNQLQTTENSKPKMYIKFSSLSIPSFTTAHIAGNIKRLLYFYALIFYKSSNLPALLFCLDNEI